MPAFFISSQFICNSGSLVLLFEVLSAGHHSGHPNDKVYPSHAWMYELMDSKRTLKNSQPHTTVNTNSKQKENNTEEKHKLRIDMLFTKDGEGSPAGINEA
jgi:hypothetical protein